MNTVNVSIRIGYILYDIVGITVIMLYPVSDLVNSNIILLMQNQIATVRFTSFDRVISSFHIATNVLFKFDLLNENDHAQDYDLFLYLTQSRFDSIDCPVYDYHLCRFVMVVIDYCDPVC
jgi:hypothetical protein